MRVARFTGETGCREAPSRPVDFRFSLAAGWPPRHIKERMARLFCLPAQYAGRGLGTCSERKKIYRLQRRDKCAK